MLIIINSHSDSLYPSRLSFLATGGIGNELFFMISGYLFSAKDNISADIRKRFIRLYTPAYIILFLYVLFGNIKIGSWIDFIRIFIWPTQFWFVGTIFLYSIVLYCFKDKITYPNHFFLLAILLLSLDVIAYIFLIGNKSVWIVEDAYFGFIPYRCIYSLFSFFLGYYLRVNSDIINKLKRTQTVLSAVIFFILVYAFKILLAKNIVPMEFQIVSHALTILSSLFIFLAFLKFSSLNDKLLCTKIGDIFNSLSGLSLETYLV